MLFLDYKTVTVDLNGSNASQDRLLYTAEYKALVWIEVPNLPGFNNGKFSYIDKQYTGDQTINADQIFWKAGNAVSKPELDNIDLIGLAFVETGDAVRFNTGDDDYSGQIIVHVARLPESQ